MNNCLSCQFLREIDDIRLLYTGQYWIIELNPDQQYLAKAVVTLRRHVARLSELTPEEGKEFFDLAKRFESAVEKCFHPTHFNWSCLMNDAAGSGAPMHVHWHAIPRYKEAKQFQGHEFIDQQWPKSARDMEPNRPGVEILKAMRDSIKLGSIEIKINNNVG